MISFEDKMIPQRNATQRNATQRIIKKAYPRFSQVKFFSQKISDFSNNFGNFFVLWGLV